MKGGIIGGVGGLIQAKGAIIAAGGSALQDLGKKIAGDGKGGNNGGKCSPYASHPLHRHDKQLKCYYLSLPHANVHVHLFQCENSESYFANW